MRFSSLLTLMILLTSLSGCISNKSEPIPPKQSNFVGYFNTPETSIPFRFIMSDSSFTVLNGEEAIDLQFVEYRKDTLVFRFPQYDSYLGVVKTDSVSGWWQPSASSVKPTLYFTAHPYNFKIDVNDFTDSLVEYQSTFYRNDSSFAFDAIANMRFYRKAVSGTFLTETGDFRFLQGEKTSDGFWLSTFDGDHLYYVVAQLDDSHVQSGHFYSGVKSPYYWSGKPTTTPEISDPYSLTYLHESLEGFPFVARDFGGDSLFFDNSKYQNHVTVVSIFGSWCPNCHDELKMYAELITEINDTNLRVIPVAFERGQDIEMARKAVDRVKKYTGFTETCYYGGESSKQSALAVFSQLNDIVAFPTSVFIDKFGNVRKIHTGFNGPGTGPQYLEYKKEVSKFLESLLKE